MIISRVRKIGEQTNQLILRQARVGFPLREIRIYQFVRTESNVERACSPIKLRRFFREDSLARTTDTLTSDLRNGLKASFERVWFIFFWRLGQLNRDALSVSPVSRIQGHYSFCCST